MRFYIASSWNNRESVRALAEQLKNAGHTQTHDWTTHEISDGWEQREAYNDINGVLSADVLILLLPGGYGAHVELGLALAENKPVLVCMEHEEDAMTPNGYVCPFYWGSTCQRIVGTTDDIKHALEVMDGH